MRDSFIFYKSYSAAFNWLAPDEELAIRRAIENYAFDGVEPEQLSNASRAIFEIIRPHIDSSNERYDKTVEGGKKGGRPRSWVDRAEAEAIYAETHSWTAVAEKLNVNEKTLRGARWQWEQDDGQNGKNGKNPGKNGKNPGKNGKNPGKNGKNPGKNGKNPGKNGKNPGKNGKNLNYNDNENYKVTYNSSLSNNKIVQKNRDDASARQQAALSSLENQKPPDGYEWSGGVQTAAGHYYRCIINKTTKEAELIQID